MILLFYHFIFACLSNDQNRKSEIYNQEMKKVVELEQKLNQTLDLVFQYVQKTEQSITINKGKDFQNQLEDLIKQAEQIVNNSKSHTNSTLLLIPLTMEKIDYQPADTQLNFSYPGFQVPGNYPIITYKPVIKLTNHPAGVFFYNITSQSCEANELAFTFYFNATYLPSKTFYLNQNRYNATFSINDIDNFDMLEVAINSKNGNSSYTCIPNFIIYENNNEN